MIAAVLVLAACSDNGDSADPGTGVEIVTTTTAASPASSAPRSTDPPSTAMPSTTSDTTTDSTTPATTTSDTTTDSTTPDTTTPATTSTTVPPRVGEPSVAVELVADFDRPVDLVVRPGDPAFHIVNQTGTVVRFDPETGDRTVTLDVAGRIAGGGEQGLLGLEFSPTGDLAYVNLTANGGDTVISEFAVGDDGVLDPGSERVLLTVDQPYSNHNAGDLAFGPDGLLYIPLGDGGSGGDPERRASDPSSLLGSLLRIDPTPGDDLPYTIPDDNPFATGPFEGVDGRPEVFAWGLRNPWKIAFDPPEGRLWIPDVGQNRFEEVNRVDPLGDTVAGWGVDFGWSAFEGTERFNDDVPVTGDELPPVLTYEHGADGCSVSGGEVYRGSAIRELAPAFVFSDYCSGILWAYDLDGARVLTLLEGLDGVTAVRAGPDGELYVLQAGGGLLRLVPG